MGELLSLTRNSLRRQLGRPRVVVAVLLTVCCSLLAFFEVPAYLAAHDARLQALEPFIFLFAGVRPELPVLSVFLVLAGDAPFFHTGLDSTLSRTTRRKWLLAQLTAVLVLTLLWLIFFLLCSLCLFGRDLLSLDNRWSALGRVLARTGRGEAAGFGLGAKPSMDLIQGRTPLVAFGVILLLNGMQYVCIAMWCMTLNLWTKRSYGSVLLVVFWLLRRIGASGDGWRVLNWLNPIGLTALGAWDVQPQTALRIGGIFVLEVVALWFFSLRRFRRMDVTK